MKRLMMLAVAGLMALMLGACGENAPKQPAADEVKTDATVEQSQDQKPVDATSTDAAPTDAAPSDTTTTQE